MKFKIVIIIMALSSTPLFAEYVFLKNGKIISGKIVSETKDYVAIQDSEKKDHKISHNDILRTVYRELYLEKQLVQMTSGKRFEAYLVNEDRKSYYFRVNLDSSDERIIDREKVLYLSRNNPTDLKGFPNETSVKLEWKAPYRQPKKYIIYFKETEDKNYKKINEAYNTSFEVKALLKKTKYSFLVKGFDGETESLPSNEINVLTTIPPEKPYGITTSEIISEDKKFLTIILKWKANAKDKNILKYMVYQIEDDDQKKIGETDKTFFSVEKLDPKKSYLFLISTINKDGAESEMLKVLPKKRFGIILNGSVSIPANQSSQIVQPGLNTALLLDYRFLYADSVSFFISAILGGTFSMYQNYPSIPEQKNLFQWAAVGGFGFGFVPLYWFGIELKILSGYVYSMLENVSFKTNRFSNDALINVIIEPQFYIIPNLALLIDIGYSAVFYTGTVMHSFNFGAGISFRF